MVTHIWAVPGTWSKSLGRSKIWRHWKILCHSHPGDSWGQNWLLLFWNYHCTKAHRTSNFLDHLYFYQIDLLKKLTSSSEPFLLYSSQVITRHDMTSFKGRFQVLLCGLGGAPKICNLFYGKIYFRKGGRGPCGGEPAIPHFFLHQKQVLFGLKASFLAHFWLV